MFDLSPLSKAQAVISQPGRDWHCVTGLKRSRWHGKVRMASQDPLRQPGLISAEQNAGYYVGSAPVGAEAVLDQWNSVPTMWREFHYHDVPQIPA